jgi:hypothetical protein
MENRFPPLSPPESFPVAVARPARLQTAWQAHRLTSLPALELVLLTALGVFLSLS